MKGWGFMENVMKLEKKKGFTLIELMIVLAVIAILAVVLIPKSQIFKNNSKNAGVITNVNTVRGYLETKITNNGGASQYLGWSQMQDAVKSDFGLTGRYQDFSPVTNATNAQKDNQIVNPFGKDKVSVRVSNQSGSINDTISPRTNETSSHEGAVIIYVYSDGYAVFGVDKGGTTTQIFKVK